MVEEATTRPKRVVGAFTPAPVVVSATTANHNPSKALGADDPDSTSPSANQMSVPHRIAAVNRAIP